MKRFGKVLLVALAVIVLSAGCSLKAEYNTTISSDGKVNFKMVMAYDEELISGLQSIDSSDFSLDENITDETEEPTQSTESSDLTEEEIWAFVDESFKDSLEDEDYVKAEKYQKDGFYGYEFTMKESSLDELSTEDKNAKVTINDDDLTSNKWFYKEGTTYTSILGYNNEDEEIQSMAQYGVVLDMKLSITLPVKATSNNATTVSDDGYTYTWDLLNTSKIELVFDMADAKASTAAKNNSTSTSSKNDKLIYIGVGGICLVAVIVVVVIILNGKKKNDTVETTTVATPVEPVAPTTPVEPTTPVTPAEPVQPVQPAEPVVQAQPVEPVVPTTPVEPVMPDVPTMEPPTAQPTEPTDNQQQ